MRGAMSHTRRGLPLAAGLAAVILAAWSLVGGWGSFTHTVTRDGIAQGAIVDLCGTGPSGPDCTVGLETPMLEILPGDAGERHFDLHNAGDVALGALTVTADLEVTPDATVCPDGVGCEPADAAAGVIVTIELCTGTWAWSGAGGTCTGAWTPTAVTATPLTDLTTSLGGANLAPGLAVGATSHFRATITWSDDLSTTLTGSEVLIHWALSGAARDPQATL